MDGIKGDEIVHGRMKVSHIELHKTSILAHILVNILGRDVYLVTAAHCELCGVGSPHRLASEEVLDNERSK